MPDEPDCAELSSLLYESGHRVITSELTRIEFASAVATARNSGRIPDARPALAQFDADSSSGALTLVPFDPPSALSAAYRLVCEHHTLRTLDALHLAVALHDTAALVGDEPVTFVTRDERQAEAAVANGLHVC
ncbi:type II toxin-antitoxin system VapC family toxin [Prauserella sp. ASG 168]|uniref:Type II toxin-antitoxin system VapC family toxin n=2 Tax=Prauserella cavernicola TaxID=2800127 RepID=A0A934V2G9_9PSEU|nr:type II toxin-antitoxin system VapC family toxin [Prauserella cavernicola]